MFLKPVQYIGVCCLLMMFPAEQSLAQAQAQEAPTQQEPALEAAANQTNAITETEQNQSAIPAEQASDTQPESSGALIRNDADTDAYDRYEPGELLIFSVIVERYKLGEVFAVVGEDTLYFELPDYFATLDFAINYDSETSSYAGWFIKEDYDFALTQTNDDISVRLKGESMRLEASDFTMETGVLAVSERVIKDWFGISHRYNFNDLTLTLSSTEVLPVIAKVRRRNRSIYGGARQTNFINLPRSYGVLSPQAFDIQLGSSMNTKTGTYNYNYGALGSRELLYHNVDFFLSGNKNKALSQSTISLSKRSMNSDLLGIGATQYEFGDISPVRVGTSSQNLSRGFKATNTGLRTNFDTELINITGEVQVGWDAELYRNGVLVDQQFDIQNGRYEFYDVNLLFGQNAFEIVLYGPQGEIRRERVDRLVDSSTLSSLGFAYEVSVAQLNQTVFGRGDRKITDADGNEIDSGYTANVSVAKNLADNLSGNLRFGTVFGGDQNSQSLSTGINTVVADSALLNAAFSTNLENNFSFNTSLRGQLLGQSLSLNYSHAQSKDDENEWRTSDGLFLSVDGGLELPMGVKVNTSSRLSVQRSGDNLRQTYQSGTGVNLGRVSLFNNFSYQEEKVDGETTSRSKVGVASIQSSFGRVYGRLGANYDLEDLSEVKNLNASIDWNINNRYKTGADISYNPASDSFTTSLQATHFNDTFSISGNLFYNETTGSQIGLNARFGVGAQPFYQGDAFVTSRSLNSRGQVVVRVFDDANLNAQYDEGETLLEGVQVESVESFARAVTDDKGIAVLESLSPFKDTGIELISDTFPDPFYVPLIEGVEVTPREAYIDTLDFPVALAGEIEGMIMVETAEGEIQEVKNLPIRLVNSNGVTVQSLRSEFDGYFFFERVFPGDYRIELDVTAYQGKPVYDLSPISVVMPKGGDLVMLDTVQLYEVASRERFFAEVARFDSDNFLTFYAAKIRQLAPQARLSTLIDLDTNEHLLVAAASHNEAAIVERCQQLETQGVDCKVSRVAVELPRDVFFRLRAKAEAEAQDNNSVAL